MTIWTEIDTLLRGYGAQPVGPARGTERGWRVPTAERGNFLVEVTVRSPWCRVTVDRWQTTDRDPETVEWMERILWPYVQGANQHRRGKYGLLPTGTTIATAFPIAHGELLEVLALWVAAELRAVVPAQPRVSAQRDRHHVGVRLKNGGEKRGPVRANDPLARNKEGSAS
jgi:hypothetical protein